VVKQLDHENNELIIEYDEENRENTFKWMKSGITRVYKYNEELLLTEVRYDDEAYRNTRMMKTLTETVRRTEMATRRTGNMMTRAI